METSWKYVDLSRYERLVDFPKGTRNLEGKKEYFLKRAQESQDPIEANSFRKIAEIITIAMTIGAEIIYVRLNHSNVKQPVLCVSFEYPGLKEVLAFERMIRKMEV